MPRRTARTSPWPMIAIGLWLPTLLGGVWLWSTQTGSAGRVMAPADDPRTGIPVTLEEEELTLRIMRANLDNLHQLLRAIAENDRPRVARLATEAAQMPGPARSSASLRAKLPDGWRALGKQVDGGFEKLATVANTPDGDLLGPLTESTAVCLACHNQYRLDLQL